MMRRPQWRGSVAPVTGILAMLASLVPAMVTAQTAPASTFPADTEIRRILADRVDTHRQTLGIIVGTSDDAGHRIIAYGARAKGDARPIEADAVLEIGSITKVFTSLLLADAVRRGDVGLSDPIENYVPPGTAVPRRSGKSITLVDLATHTSALPRLPTNFIPRDNLNPYADYTTEQLYQFVSTVTLGRDIGSQYEYSNAGAGLLGQLLSRHLGADYETLVRTRITGPLGMASTAITLDAGLEARLVPGHDVSQEPTPGWDLPALTGAGGLRSTVRDMLTFLDAASGRRASPLGEAFTTMLATRRPTGTAGLDIALGWHILGGGDDEIVWHNGGTGGYRSWIGFNPRTRRAVVILTNTTGPAGPDDIGRHLLNPKLPLLETFPSAPTPRIETRLSPEVFDRYVGHYAFAPEVLLTVTRDGDRFMAQLAGQGTFQIFAESDNVFFLKVVDAQLVFETDTRGVVTAVVLHQNGRSLRATRVN